MTAEAGATSRRCGGLSSCCGTCRLPRPDLNVHLVAVGDYYSVAADDQQEKDGNAVSRLDAVENHMRKGA